MCWAVNRVHANPGASFGQLVAGSDDGFEVARRCLRRGIIQAEIRHDAPNQKCWRLWPLGAQPQPLTSDAAAFLETVAVEMTMAALLDDPEVSPVFAVLGAVQRAQQQDVPSRDEYREPATFGACDALTAEFDDTDISRHGGGPWTSPIAWLAAWKSARQR